MHNASRTVLRLSCLGVFALALVACDSGNLEPTDTAKPEKADAEPEGEAGEKEEEKAPEPEPEPEAAETGTEEATAGETGAAPEEGGEKADEADEGDKGSKQAKGSKGGDKPAKNSIDGKPLFLKKCKSCHGADGKGDTKLGRKVKIPSLVKTKLGKAKVAAIITNGVKDTKMKAYKKKLSGEEIDALAIFIKKL